MSGLAAFLDGFVRPLVEGGPLHVGAPLALSQVTAWENELGAHGTEVLAVDAARAAVVGELVLRPPTLALSGEDLRLAAALYDLLAAQHPDLERTLAPSRARARALATARALAELEPPTGRGDVLGRHALLSQLWRLSREDVHVTWWTGKAEYAGRKPPPRITAWSGLRQVRQERRVVPVAEILQADDARGVLAALLRASPLTDLLTPSRPLLPFRWTEAAAALLEDAELTRAVLARWLGAAPTVETLARHPAAASAALGELLSQRGARRGRDPASVRRIVAFLVHAGLLVALSERARPDSDAPSELVASVLGLRQEGAALLFVLPTAVTQVDPVLAQPPGLDDDPALARRWRAHRAQARAALGEPLFAGVVESLEQVLSSG